MRINEAYEHEPLLPCQAEESGKNCCSCNKVGAQCVDVAAPLILTPSASVGSITVSCQGGPTISCVSEPDGSSCTVTMTQKICVSVPVRYGVTMSAGAPTIACADGSCAICG